MGHQVSLRQIISLSWRQKILCFILIFCMTGLSFMVFGKYVERVCLLDKSKLEIKLPYLKGNPKYERSSNGNLEVYDLYTKIDEDIECKKFPKYPQTYVCLYDSNIDHGTSAHIEKGKLRESVLIDIFKNLLREDEELGLLDLGANIGMYSMVAAAMNRSVLAVEPMEGNLKRLAKGVQVNEYQDLITVLPYAITDIRTKLPMAINPKQQGAHRLVVDKEHDVFPELKKIDVETILMDDLEPYVPFKVAIMKMDIEGQEHRVFLHSKALMDKVEFPYIFMEWRLLRSYNKIDGTEDSSLTVQLIDLLTTYGYTPFNPNSFQGEKIKLETTNWGQWPADIIWSKKDN